ncbi:MAG: response regulator transcription factor [Oscillospiraceae bacterium]|nr:response regulator transcription factor [Oscillospiraceae bacterium]
MQKILLIDDNDEILSVNKSHLTRQGFSVTCADTGIKAIALLKDNQYDCIVLDILLPDLDGFTICKAVRTITDTPILFLSCLEEADDKVKGLMAGGDDYMTKPCSLKELTARINALLRRNSTKENKRAGVSIDRDTKIINALGKSVLLSEREFDLFILLYENRGKSFSKEELFEKVWHGNAEMSVVTSLILRLRRKIDFAGDVIGKIVSEYGKGYYLMIPSSRRGWRETPGDYRRK